MKKSTNPENRIPPPELIFEKSIKGRTGFQVPLSDVPAASEIPATLRRKDLADLPEVSELDVVRHFTKLSQKNFSVDTHFYPLGSCTMKYNPKITESLVGISGVADLHPLLPQLRQGEKLTQGALEVFYEMDQVLCEITGMDKFTLQPLAGAHGELTGVMMMAAYHKARGNKKKYILIPDSAHGTNPATAAIAGYETISIPSNKDGVMDLAKLEEKLNPEVAGLMLTCPNTLGLFNADIDKIARMVHDVDGLMYYDGANLNAIMGRCRPGDLGFDCIHVNLHKTFATPHGGGGPGAGPVGVKEKLLKYLPISLIVKRDVGRPSPVDSRQSTNNERQAERRATGDERRNGTYALNYDYPESIGYIASFYGNFAVILKAYIYILLLGKEGLKGVSDHAVLNANYITRRLKKYFHLPYDRLCMHESVLSASRQVEKGVHAIDIAKYLIDKGMHPPTVYFPLIVKEAIMIEPTESESKQSMDTFIDAMIEAAALIQKKPEIFKTFPQTMPITRPDEVRAARECNINYFGVR